MTLAVAEPGQAVRRVLTKEQVLEFVEEPLKQLPADWRIPAWDFWAFFSHLLPNQLALCTRLRWWIDNDGLTFDEARRAFDRMRSTERAGACQFASQVLGGLGDMIEEIRKADRDTERKQRQKDGDGPYSMADLLKASEEWKSFRETAK